MCSVLFSLSSLGCILVSFFIYILGSSWPHCGRRSQNACGGTVLSRCLRCLDGGPAARRLLRACLAALFRRPGWHLGGWRSWGPGEGSASCGHCAFLGTVWAGFPFQSCLLACHLSLACLLTLFLGRSLLLASCRPSSEASSSCFWADFSALHELGRGFPPPSA